VPAITSSDSIATLGIAQTFTAVKTFNAAPVISSITNGGGALTLPSGVTDTIVARTTTDTLQNKSLVTGNVAFVDSV
jgi:hypothetical protein